jgi:hypothetical protein
VAVVSVGSASERKHGARRSPERVSRRTRHPESASRRDTTIERRMRARDASIRRRARREILAFGDGTRAAPSAPGVARHLLVATRAGRSAQRARTTQRARRALAAPRPRRSSARATRGKPTCAVRSAGARTQHEARRGATRALASTRAEARAPKRAREERDVKVMPRRARRTCGVVGERAYALRARKCRGARGGVPSGIDTRFVGTKKNAQLCVVV